MRRLLLIVIALIVYGSLYPWHFDFDRTGSLPAVLIQSVNLSWDRFLFRDFLLNVLLYMPLGAAAWASLGARRHRVAAAGAAVLCGMLLSLALETLQNFVPGRDPSLVDVAANTAGAAAGALLALAFWPEPAARGGLRLGRRATSGGFLAGCWIAYQLYPLVPVVSLTRLHGGLAALAHPAGISAPDVWVVAAGWFAAALAAEALLGRMRTVWLLAGMLCLPARLFIPGRAVNLGDLLGAGLAVLLWLLLGRWRPAGLWLLGSAILVRELAPLHFGGPAAAFSWVPFAASMDSTRQSAVVILLEKAFEYGALVWLCRGAGLRYRYGGLGLAAALAILEWTQRYLPGRTPEITDSVLALLLAFVLWRLDSAPREAS